MSQSKFTCLVAALMGAHSIAHSIDIDGASPTVTIVDPVAKSSPSLVQFEANLNATLDASFKATLDTARQKLARYHDQKDLAQGFANANAYSINSATLQGFQNYSLFAVSSGFMVGVQAPSTDLAYLKKIDKEIKDKGDIFAGLGLGFSFLNVGINAGMLVPGLYVNAKYGALDWEIGDFAVKFQVMGVGANYRLLDSKSLAGIVKWRGLSVGTGFYMQRNEIDFEIQPDTIHKDVPFRARMIGSTTGADSLARAQFMNQIGYTESNPNADIAVSPEFTMGLNVNTMTVPFDVATGVSFLWGLLSVTAGAGFDLNFGSSEIVLEGSSDAAVSSDTTKVKFTKATVSVDGGSDNGPSFSRVRLMAGLGTGLGPVKLDIPMAFYPASGFAFGVTAAVVW